MRTVQGEWQFNEALLVPKDAPEVQRQQTKLAFYAGCQAALRLLWNVGGDEVSEEAGAHLIQSWNDECDQFARDWAKSRGLPDHLIDKVVKGFKRPGAPS